MGSSTIQRIGFLAATSFNANAFNTDTKYQQYCGIYYFMGVTGAPETFDKIAWEPHLAIGMDTLLYSVKKDRGAIPPKGLCNDCTNNQYKALNTHMPTSK